MLFKDEKIILKKRDVGLLLLILSFSMLLLLIKIYISNEIYLTSIKLNKLINEYITLKAENQILKMKLNQIKFKNNLNSLNNFQQKENNNEI